MLSIFKKKNTESDAPKEAPKAEEKGIFDRVKEGLSKTTSKISGGINDIFTKRKLDKDTLEQLEELLIMSDLGPSTSAKLVEKISADRFDKEISSDEIKEALAVELHEILKVSEKAFKVEEKLPFVILMVGVNGAGKTTAIGKIAYKLKAEGKKVMFAAGDTFRAAAVKQLEVWGERLNCKVISKEEGADAASLAYEAIDKAIEQKADVLIIDTAGRLQNQNHLMAELEKVNRVIAKKMPDAPHETIITLDATVGQNAHSQIEIFGKAVKITGMIVTKLDGTAKGGVVVSLAEKFKLPVYFIGVGEKEEDLREFKAEEFSKILVGLE